MVAALLLLAGPTRIYTPKPGSAERKSIMDALRKVVVPKVRQTVVFKVDSLRSTGAAAFLIGTPQRPDGKPLDYKGTIFADSIREGVFGGGVEALLLKKRGRWIVDEWNLGATDVWYEGLWKRKGLPRALFAGASD